MRWLPALGWMGLIFFLSNQSDLPHAPGAWLDTVVKKGGHALVFGILARLYLYALQGSGAACDRLRGWSFALAVVYAMSDEAHQAYVPGRNPAVWDVLIDAVGAATAMGVHRLLAQASSRR